MNVTTDTIWVIDFDRTLTSDHLYELVEPAFLGAGMSSGQFDVVKSETLKSGASLDVLEYVERKIGNSDDFITAFLELAAEARPETLLAPGATAFLDALERSGVPWLILTYGSERWQTIKLNAVGFDRLPVVITDSPEKSRVASEWFDEREKLFHAPFHAPKSNVMIVDDKRQAFDTMRESMRGIWVGGAQNECPPHVRVVESLIELLDEKT